MSSQCNVIIMAQMKRQGRALICSLGRSSRVGWLKEEMSAHLQGLGPLSVIGKWLSRNGNCTQVASGTPDFASQINRRQDLEKNISI